MLGDVSAASAFLLAAFLVLSAFFSGSEAALLSVQRLRLQHLIDTRVAGASRVARMIESPERLLPPILLGNNLVNTGAAALTTSLALTVIVDETQAVTAATVAVTVMLLIFGETIPKTIAARHAERVSIVVAPPIQGLSWLLKPISYVLQSISVGIAGLIGGGTRSEITDEEIKTMVEVGHREGTVEPTEAEMIRRVLEFGDRRVSELMTPRPEIVAVDEGISISEFLALYNDKYHTRFPVIRGNLDDVVGLIGVKDVMRQLARGANVDASATAGVRPARFVPETKRVQQLFDEMRTSGAQVVMVADEFGGVAGLVTLKRLIEGIVGPVEDEEQPGGVKHEVQPLDEDTVEIDGGLTIMEANDRLGLGLPQGEYETVAGYILGRIGSIPAEGDSISLHDYRFSVLEMRGTRIARVRVTRAVTEE